MPRKDRQVAAALQSIATKMRKPAFLEGLPICVGNERDSVILGSVTLAEVAGWEERVGLKLRNFEPGVGYVDGVELEGRFRSASRHDLLVAFALSSSARSRSLGPASVTVVIGGKIASELTVQPGGWTYALRGRFPVPTLALQFHEVSVRVSPPELEAEVRAVLAIMPGLDVRTEASTNGFRCVDGDDNLVISNGMLSILNKDTLYPEYPLPDMTAI
jgi:hypothetical protein